MLLRIVMACYVAMRVTLGLGLLRRAERTRAQPMVSVLVAARNEAAALPSLLDALLQQRYPAFEIVIADDRSTDTTPAVLAVYAARDSRVRSVRVDALPPGQTPKMHALAQAAAVARGELLLLTDADCAVRPGWIAGLAAAFAAPVGVVVGYVALRAPHRTLLEHVQALDYFAMMALTAGATKLGQPIGAAGANIAYRRAAYDAVGGFAAMPLGAVADDMLLLQRVVDWTDWRVAFCDDPAAFVATDAEPTLRLLLSQRLRWMAGGHEVLRHNPALLLVSSLIGTFNGMLVAFPVFLLRRDLRRSLAYALAGRFVGDLLHLGLAAWRFRCLPLLAYLPLWSVLQVPYTLVMPLLALVRKWTWK